MDETDKLKVPLDEFAERIERVFEEIGRDQKRLAAEKKARPKCQDRQVRNPNNSRQAKPATSRTAENKK